MFSVSSDYGLEYIFLCSVLFIIFVCVGVCEKERLREIELERKRWRETEREECHSMTRPENTFLSWFSPFSSEAVFPAFFFL